MLKYLQAGELGGGKGQTFNEPYVGYESNFLDIIFYCEKICVTSQSQPEPSQPTKNPFIHLRNEQVFRKKSRVVCLHSYFYIFGMSLCMNFYIIW